jgi:hypothetical protein
MTLAVAPPKPSEGTAQPEPARAKLAILTMWDVLAAGMLRARKLSPRAQQEGADRS